VRFTVRICTVLIFLLILNSCDSFRNYINKFSDNGSPIREDIKPKERKNKETVTDEQQTETKSRSQLRKEARQQQQEAAAQQTEVQQEELQQEEAQQVEVKPEVQQAAVQQVEVKQEVEVKQQATTIVPTENKIFNEANNGMIRLVLNSRTSSFSLFYAPDPEGNLRVSRSAELNKKNAYIPLISHKNPNTSYLSLYVNKKIHRLGKSRSFKTNFNMLNGDPAFIFESEALLVTQSFTPVKTTNASSANGVMITVSIENKKDEEISVGLKMLLDTILSERRGSHQFEIGKRVIKDETQIKGLSGEKYWISRGNGVSLMGSIVNPENLNDPPPDYIHFANWKRLNDASWSLRYYEGRSFNNLPYSINDSAVCYYYEPVVIARGQIINYSIYLTSEDAQWYYPVEVEGNLQALRSVDVNATQILQQSNMEEKAQKELSTYTLTDSDRATLERMQELLNKFISGEINLNEKDLAEIERVINSYRN